MSVQAALNTPRHALTFLVLIDLFPALQARVSLAGFGVYRRSQQAWRRINTILNLDNATLLLIYFYIIFVLIITLVLVACESVV